MAGDTWTNQDKIRSGVYTRFTSDRGLGLTVSDRDVVVIAEAMSWGPMETVWEIGAGANMTPYTGYDITNPKNRFLSEISKGISRTTASNRLPLYCLEATGRKRVGAEVSPPTTVVRYPGVRGNDISIIITELTDPKDAFPVSMAVDGEIVDQQAARTVEELAANDWVAWSGTGALTAMVGKALSDGTDGSSVSADYTDLLAAIEPYEFDVFIYDGADTAVQDAMAIFAKRLVAEKGAYAQLAVAGLTNPDGCFVVNIIGGIMLSDDTALAPQQVTWWADGVLARVQYNGSLTYATYPNTVDVSPKLTNSGYIDALTTGQFVLLADNGVVEVEQDTNSLAIYTTDITEPYHKNRVIRLLNAIANDIYQQFSGGYIGVVSNNGQGRMMSKSAIVEYLLDIQANNGIQNFEVRDVTMEPGEVIGAITVNLAIQPVDNVEKIHVTITVN